MKQDKFEIEEAVSLEVQQTLVKANITEFVIDELQKELTPFTQMEVTNEAEYGLMRGAAKKATNMCTPIVSLCKRGRDPHIIAQREWIKKEKDLLALVKPLKDALDARKTKWKEREQERINEAARALATLHQNREKRLLEAGFRKDGESVWRLRDWSLTQDEVTGLGVVDGELHDWIADCERQHKNLLVKERIAKEENDAIVEQARKNAERLEQLEREDKERKEKEARLQLRHDRGVELNIAANGGPWAIDRNLEDLSQEDFERLKQEVFDAAQQLAQQPEPPDDPPVFDDAPPEEPMVLDIPQPDVVDQRSDRGKLQDLLSKLEALELPTLTPENVLLEKRQQHWYNSWHKNLTEQIASL